MSCPGTVPEIVLLLTLKLSNTIDPVPFARSSKLLLDNVVCTTFPWISISPVLNRLDVTGVLTTRLVVVKAPVTIVFFNVVVPDVTVKF